MNDGPRGSHACARRYLALKFNIDGRDMGSVVNDAIATVSRSVQPPEGHYFVWGGEFGRSPDNGIRRGDTTWGRDHNPAAMTMWFAGGGVKAGHIVGATDEIGQKAVEVTHPMRDVHVTILDLMGLEDAKLTYFHSGRFRQLSQFGGQVIQEIKA